MPMRSRSGGGRVTVVDTGGLLLDDETIRALIRSQAEEAIRGANVVVFLLDGEAGPIPEDRDIATICGPSACRSCPL